MAYGMRITKDGRLWASPQFTPMNLVQVFDRSYNQRQNTGTLNIQIATNVPEGRRFLFFVRSGRATTCLLANSFVQGGMHYIRIYNMADNGSGAPDVISFRFYIFSDFVAYTPKYGISFHREGRMVYCGNCLPLVPKFATRSSSGDVPVNVPAAVVPSFEGIEPIISGVPPTVISSLIMGYAGSNSGIVIAPYNPNGGSSFDSGVSGRGTLYIETALIDQYYVASLGY